jgi:hypothetical protein
MIDFDNLTRDDWIMIYERLNEDFHLSERGYSELMRLKEARREKIK